MSTPSDYSSSSKLLKLFSHNRFGWDSSPTNDPCNIPPAISSTQGSTERNVNSIPVEVMIKILKYLVARVLPEALAFTYRRPTFVRAPGLESRIQEAQRILFNLSLASHSMHGVGTEFLYSRPFLPTVKHLRLFHRTLTQVPELSHFVKEILVLDIEPAGKALSRLNLVNILNPGKRDPDVSPAQAELITVLDRCTTVETLTINVERSVSPVYDLDKLFPPPTSSHTHLRRLVMNGCEFYTSFSMSNKLSLPALEVLCLRGLYIRSTFDLPHLPRLHTLQIAHVYRSQGILKKVMDPLTLPSLHTLELFQNHDMGLEFTRDLATVLPALKRVHIVGSHYEYPVFSTWASPSRLGTLHELVVGVLFTSSANLVNTWRIPQMLESLTFVVSLESYLSPEATRDIPPPDILGCLNAFLEYNAQAIRNGPLRRLTIISSFPGSAGVLGDVRVTNELDGIRMFCGANGIEFFFDTLGE